MPGDLRARLAGLRRWIRGTGGLAVAFSGGVDSTFLLAVAKQELGDRVAAVTATSPTYPESEREAAGRLAAGLGVRHVVVESNELEIEGFRGNPPDRCYLCKSELFRVVAAEARKLGLPHVADATNADDAHDYRPGMRAARDAGARSPLLEAGLTKAEIRDASRAMGLPTWDKPGMACLASRFPFGQEITARQLKAVGRAEEVLRRLGATQVRVRVHGPVARIELDPQDVARFATPDTRAIVAEALEKLGFTYVCLDLRGYCMGSMNRTLPIDAAGESIPSS